MPADDKPVEQHTLDELLHETDRLRDEIDRIRERLKNLSDEILKRTSLRRPPD